MEEKEEPEAELSLLEYKLIKNDLPIMESQSEITPGRYKINLVKEERVYLALYGGFLLDPLTFAHSKYKLKTNALAGTPNFVLAVLNDKESVKDKINLWWLYAYKGGWASSIRITCPRLLNEEKGISSSAISQIEEPLETDIKYSFLLHYQGFKHLFDYIASIKDFVDINHRLNGLFSTFKLTP